MAAQKKKNQGRESHVSVSAAKKRAMRGRGSPPAQLPGDRAVHQLLPFAFAVFGAFFLFCILVPSATGAFGSTLHDVSLGLFGSAALIVPIAFLIEALFWQRDVNAGACLYKLVFALLVLFSVSIILQLCFRPAFDAAALYNSASASGGGVVGGWLSMILTRYIGTAGTWIVSLVCFLLCAVFFIGRTPRNIVNTCRAAAERRREERAERQLLFEQEEEARRREQPARTVERPRESAAVKKPPSHPRLDRNIYTDDEPYDGEAVFAEPTPEPVIGKSADGTQIDQEVFDEAFEAGAADIDHTGEPQQETPAAEPGTETLKPVIPPPQNTETGELDLARIFANPKDIEMEGKYGRRSYRTPLSVQEAEVELAVKRSDVGGEAEKTPDTKRRKAQEKPRAATRASAPQEETMPGTYRFPPLSLLRRGANMQNYDATPELQENAAKLIETLESFHVHARVVNVSRGPTITRYELALESGTRVRSIANLVDDIALNLAASGVRIEAPIPGKSAVGIEVPNKSAATVYIRDLLDSTTFRSADSRLSCVLGMDVAGAPIYCDLAKMPHLLIAGATGMGKSVCLNSLIISILYKATPKEVKLILIDPKKVEFNVYNGIPHLLVPVVSDPKKAAGSLHWAVTEMERRFTLIEEVGVRDLRGYDEMTRDDPEREELPQIVIVIDELADLMMTASDDVEASICRLAQKARAAGMHLVIGTQRPSVDVITGLIKSNLPSRIAFHVSSQIDSRVVLDTIGAEKLIGRGDMLYAPVGMTKPLRVQGSFVSDKEVEAVTDFLRKAVGEAEYSGEIIDTIEKEAQLCGQKKRPADEVPGGDEGDDPMMSAAVELAVESGKISTSLIQRRLSLGYGRAAKLIDRMEQLGYVSAPEGQKPRAVLISKQQWMEKKLRTEDEREA